MEVTETQATEDAPEGEADVERAAFELFPYGIAVFGADRGLAACNNVARTMLREARDAVPDGERPTCCRLLGCGSGPLEGACFSDLARENGAALPEVRVDLVAPGAAQALWVTAAPLDPEEGTTVVQLRPGEIQDRRRRTNPHWTGGPQLRIYALGRTQVESREGPIGGKWLERRPGEIFKYLICERKRVVHTDEIAESIWPGSDPRISSSVRHFVHALRDRLEPGRPKRAPSTFVVSRQGGYALDLNRVSIDVDEFEAKAEAGLAAYERGATASAAAHLDAAVEMYRGDFLAEEPYAQWALAERDRLRDLASEALRALAEIRLAEGDRDAAAAAMERLADMQPFDSEVHRELIALSLARGRRSEAVRRYGALRQRLMREFDEEPEFRLSDVSPTGSGEDHSLGAPPAGG